MNLSRYFHELQDGYLSEIEDLRLDTEGNDVLQRRLADKRKGFPAIVSMLDTDPLMLAPALHGAFFLPAGRVPAIEDLLGCEPDELPSWSELARQVEVAAWARPLVELALAEEAGQGFLATVVGLEYLLARQRADAGIAPDGEAEARDGRDEHGERDEFDEGERDDGAEGLGEDFLEQQGFDRRIDPDMTHPIVKTVSGMVYEGDIESAERALAVLADQEGDLALAKVIDEMPPRDVVAILREHDSSKLSIVGELISPEQFVAAVVLERDYREKNHDVLRGMVNAVVFADERRTDDFIVALGASEDGLNALVDYCSDRHEEIERFFVNGTFDEQEGEDIDGIPTSNVDLQHGELDSTTRRDVVMLREVQDGDWRELVWRLRCEHYEIFRDVMEMMRARHHKAAAEPPPPPPAEGRPAVDDDDVL